MESQYVISVHGAFNLPTKRIVRRSRIYKRVWPELYMKDLKKFINIQSEETMEQNTAVQ